MIPGRELTAVPDLHNLAAGWADDAKNRHCFVNDNHKGAIMNTMTAKSERLTRLGILQEPLGYVDGGDVYEYVKCSPTTALDPCGLEAAEWSDTVSASFDLNLMVAAAPDAKRTRPFTMKATVAVKAVRECEISIVVSVERPVDKKSKQQFNDAGAGGGYGGMNLVGKDSGFAYENLLMQTDRRSTPVEWGSKHNRFAVHARADASSKWTPEPGTDTTWKGYDPKGVQITPPADLKAKSWVRTVIHHIETEPIVLTVKRGKTGTADIWLYSACLHYFESKAWGHFTFDWDCTGASVKVKGLRYNANADVPSDLAKAPNTQMYDPPTTVPTTQPD
jgi:hypothetical protein